ncbi:hypothetical protein GALL_433630 [mine drainage metagenome]|uniref:Uncharacterized protein n=1 Tax=mine drainage metagenome TaxID=410659 RepID=A0A1J5PU33_9ZZZZ
MGAGIGIRIVGFATGGRLARETIAIPAVPAGHAFLNEGGRFRGWGKPVKARAGRGEGGWRAGAVQGESQGHQHGNLRRTQARDPEEAACSWHHGRGRLEDHLDLVDPVDTGLAPVGGVEG